MAAAPVSPEEKAERLRQLTASARQAVFDYEEDGRRIAANTERLKTLRLARDAEVTAQAAVPVEVEAKRRRRTPKTS